jgi:hypothetical protein
MVHEIMVRVETKDFVIRCWKGVNDRPSQRDIDDMHVKILHDYYQTKSRTPSELAEELIGLCLLSACEVLDHKGNGAVVYREWP